MKAKEYYKSYIKLKEDRSSEYALVKTFMGMFNEVTEIKESRGARSDEAMVSIMKEINKKGNAFARIVNRTDEENKIKEDAFKIFIKHKMPSLYSLVWNN